MCIPCIIFWWVIVGYTWLYPVAYGYPLAEWDGHVTYIHLSCFFQRQMHCKMLVGGLGVDVGNMMLSKIWIRKRILPSTYYRFFVLWSSIALSHQEVTTTTIGYFWKNHRKSSYRLVFDWSVAKTHSCTHSHDSLWFSMCFCNIAILKGTMMVYQWNTLIIPYI